MTVYYINENFKDEDSKYDESIGPWEQGYSWDEIDLFISLDDNKPKKGKEYVIISNTNDQLIDPINYYTHYSNPNWEIWEGKLSENFFRRSVKAAFYV